MILVLRHDEIEYVAKAQVGHPNCHAIIQMRDIDIVDKVKRKAIVLECKSGRYKNQDPLSLKGIALRFPNHNKVEVP